MGKRETSDNAGKKIIPLGAILPFMETFNLLFLPFAIIVFIEEHSELHYLFAAFSGNND